MGTVPVGHEMMSGTSVSYEGLAALNLHVECLV